MVMKLALRTICFSHCTAKAIQCMKATRHTDGAGHMQATVINKKQQ